MKGENGKRIICLANLRAQKDHITLLKSFLNIHKVYPDWTLHLLGKDFNDAYSASIHDFIAENKITNQVFLYGSRMDTSAILNACDVGVLSSCSEGLPLTLLEYGLAKLPVVVTNVGDCKMVVQHKKNGLIIESQSQEVLGNALEFLIKNRDISINMGNQLYDDVKANFSKDAVLNELLLRYKAL